MFQRNLLPPSSGYNSLLKEETAGSSATSVPAYRTVSSHPIFLCLAFHISYLFIEYCYVTITAYRLPSISWGIRVKNVATSGGIQVGIECKWVKWCEVNWCDLCEVIWFWREVKWVLGDKSTMHIRVTLYCGYLIILWLFNLVCILYCGCFNLFYNVWVYILYRYAQSTQHKNILFLFVLSAPV